MFINNYKTKIEYILLSCCTFNRPSLLQKSLLSIKKIVLPENIKVEILIVDNDVKESARPIVDKLSNEINLKIHYIVEKNRGLACARNKILEVAKVLNATHLMIFDDDELFTKNALMAHINLYCQYNDEILSSGISVNTFEEKTPNFIKNNLIYKKYTTKKTETIKKSSATDNIFLPMSIIKKHNLVFAEEFNFMCGEDIDFTQRISNLGYKIVQNSDSILYEPVIKSRACLKYIFKRAYCAGFCGPHIKFQSKSILKKIPYMLNLLMVLILNLLFLFFSLLGGLSLFFNNMTRIVKIIGKIAGTLSLKSIEIYKNIDGVKNVKA